MAVGHHGGFDLAVEVSVEEITALVRRLLASIALPPTTVSTAMLSGELAPQVSVESVSLGSGQDVTVRLNLEGTMLRITSVSITDTQQEPPAWLADIPIGGTVEVTHRLELRGSEVVIDFTPTSSRPPAVAVTLDRQAILDAPLVQLYMAYLRARSPDLHPEDALLELESDEASSTVRRLLGGLGVVTVVPPPPPPVTGVQLRTGPQSVHLLCSLHGGATGDPCAVIHSMLDGAGEEGPDAAAVALSNQALLGGFVRPALATALRLDPSGFVPGHPCAFRGTSPLPITLPPGIESAVTTSALAGVDEEGRLHLVVHVRAVGAGGSFRYQAAIDSAFVVTAAITGASPARLTVDAKPVHPPVVASDIAFAWWAYAATAVFAGAPAAVAMVAVDAFGGLVASGVVANLVRFPKLSMSLPLPERQPPLTVRRTSLSQEDAPARSGADDVPDRFRAHDLIITLR